MALFSKLRKPQAPNGAEDEIARSVLSLPLLVAAADGRIDDAEMHQILNMCAFSPIFHTIGAQRTHQLAGEILARLRTEGATRVFADALPRLSPKMRETALCFAIRTALADGVLEQEEKDMLVTMGETMRVPEELFMNMFSVMATLQRAPEAA